MAAAYVEAYLSGKLQRNIQRALRWLKKCTLCPRFCRVDRLSGETGYCRTGRLAVVASYGPHFGEEDPLVGRNGSGTIFFANCNLRCIFCQNYEISHEGRGHPVTAEQLAAVMLELQRHGCHNINLVTPTHVIAQILEALPLAVENGLQVPLVYNCGGYERVAALRLLEGIVDIYMPDFKFWDPRVAEAMCGAPDYPERARRAIIEMHRQVGELQIEASGLAVRGVLLRHLVMPAGLSGTPSILHFISTHVSPNTYVNIMDQYRPCGQAFGKPDIGRRITAEEYQEALRCAEREGLTRLDRRRSRLVFW
ncbi:radical SAM protein [Desulfoglaeba alkanexedens]|uniref:Radical SAM protein n=1 Tax=Desulfoglaeba alkanexedens ALDC TaxID=980445 RepID=A0A4V1ERR0_9BACT|nr:radical SAM protein [Desulfoglaeba alkanexedens]QCQ22511.1 radical SAM protein [Desulfoglaeba alkanexedens ALDC]